MKALQLALLAVLATTAYTATAAPPEESCEQIREQIKAHTGVPTRPDTILLRKIGENTKCRFTSVEVYRAAWGDKPMPKDNRDDRRSRDHGHDDD